MLSGRQRSRFKFKREREKERVKKNMEGRIETQSRGRKERLIDALLGNE